MPICVPDSLPAAFTLQQENIFVMTEKRAKSQDIRPLEIVILNLMPKKIETETQLLRVLGNTPIQVNVELLQMSTHQSKNTPSEHLFKFYKFFGDIKNNCYDGLIITGAPVEQMPFEDVDYWGELCEILDWSRTHVYSTFSICWGAQAALYHFYGVPKHPLPHKMFGLFWHDTLAPNHPLLRGFDERFLVPQSRHTEIRREDIERVPELEILVESPESGVCIVASRGGRQFFITGHGEYDPLTLAAEYRRDADAGLSIDLPKNYFPGDDPSQAPPHLWRAHGHLLYANWLNYFVYQATPFDLRELEK